MVVTMKISSKGRYGLRMMIDLALHYDGRPVPAKEIAERQQISVKYLEQIILQLSKAGLVGSVRGAMGGYRLSFPPEETTVGAVLRAVEGSLSPVDCIDADGDCPKIAGCYTAELWRRMKSAVDGVIDTTTIADLIDGREDAEQEMTGC